MLPHPTPSICAVAVAALCLSLPAQKITTPKEALGFDIGADYHLADYQQLSAYWKTLAAESDRMALEVIGKTEEGRDILMAVVTSPANHRRLGRLKEISARLARAEGVTEEQARELSEEGCAVVWIDGGLHATEVLVAQQLIETVYQMVSRSDPETLRTLDDLVLLFCNPNPDGQDLVAQWYMRNEDPKKRTSRHLPRLYQKYTGHDNNRDWYMITQKETEAVCRVFFHEWYPQIVYNHHQTGPSGTVLFAPPFRGPHNHNIDPLVILGIDGVGAAMHQRFVVEGKPGSTMRSGASYSTWWNGGLRTCVYYHNMIGLLSETIGHPTPIRIPLRAQRQLQTGDMPLPIGPQRWHFRQSVEYSLTANRAVMDFASRNRSHLLFNIWRMGMNSIEKGSRDHWTVRPDTVARAQGASSRPRNTGGRSSGGGGAAEAASSSARKGVWEEVFRDPSARDPRAYVIPVAQPDFLTATRFVNTLIKGGVTVHRATAPFEVGEKSYGTGSYVVQCAQAFRPQVIDMFEPQVHPDDIPYPGGPPTAPYDSAGWTLAFQMGVVFDRILDGLDGPFVPIDGMAKPPAGGVKHGARAPGFFLSHATNDSFWAVNQLLADGESVSWLRKPVMGRDRTWSAGTIWVANRKGTLDRLQEMAEERGLTFEGAQQNVPDEVGLRLRKVRVGLWDRYGGSMPSGWMKWILERFGFDHELVYAPQLDAGELRERFDVLVFVPGAISGARRGRRGSSGPGPKSVPEEYRDRIGRVTVAKTIPKLREFLEAGGTVCAIGSSTSLATHLGLPITDALMTRDDEGKAVSLPRDQFFVPGSILQATLDGSHPLAYGAPESIDVYFRRSPVFRLRPDAARAGIRPVGWFDGEEVLRSGWAWGEHHLKDAVAVVDARVGKGSLFLYGPEVAFRAQPHGTFKLLFNGIHYGPARSADRAR